MTTTAFADKVCIQSDDAIDGKGSNEVPADDLYELGCKLSIISDELAHYLLPDAIKFKQQFKASLHKAVEEALSSEAQLRPEVIVSRMDTRIFYETLMAWSVLRRDQSYEILVSSLDTNLQEMNFLLSCPFSDSIAKRLWNVDGAFHDLICQASNFPYLADFVRIIIEGCRRIGIPKTQHRAQRTYIEHTHIFRAIVSRDRKEVFDTIYTHVKNGISRWFEKDSMICIQDEPHSDSNEPDNSEPNDSSWVLSLFAKPIEEPPHRSVLSQMAFNSNLKHLLHQHRGKWVAFLGDEQVAIETSRESVFKVCKRICVLKNIDLSDFYVNIVLESNPDRSR